MTNKSIQLLCGAMCLVLSAQTIQAQFQESPSNANNLYHNSGNVGIGTANPSSRLDILTTGGSSGSASALRLRAGNTATYTGNNQILMSYGSGINYSHSIKTRHHSSQIENNSIDFYVWLPGDQPSRVGTKHVMSLNAGNVGIGTTNPSVTLDIEVASGNAEIDLNAESSGGQTWRIKSTASDLFKINRITGGELEVFAIDNLGRVGIGTTDPKNRLSVNGTIWAKEVKVSMTDAADWVFEEDYELKPLEEVETFVMQNKHLPDVPSAEEFRENDMNLGEMNNVLLQKMEEMTLYMININKRVNQLEEENKDLKAQIKK